MKRIFCILAVCVIVVLAASVSYGQSSTTGISNISCSAATDEGGNPICQTDEYDPCCSAVTGTMSFYRTDKQDYTFSELQYEIIGATLERHFNAYYYSQGNHTISDNGTVESTTENQIVVYHYGDDGCFTNIGVSARYSTPTAD